MKTHDISFQNIAWGLALGMISSDEAQKIREDLMGPVRTFRTDRLYHQFLKPRSIELEKLPLLVTKLYESGFIELYHNFGDDERYSETEKLTGREHRDELFKIVSKL